MQIDAILAQDVLPGMSVLVENKFSGQGVYREVEFVWFLAVSGTTHIQTTDGRIMNFYNDEYVEVSGFAYGVPDNSDDVSYAEWLASWDSEPVEDDAAEFLYY